jgi:hypothetical protein
MRGKEFIKRKKDVSFFMEGKKVYRKSGYFISEDIESVIEFLRDLNAKRDAEKKLKLNSNKKYKRKLEYDEEEIITCAYCKKKKPFVKENFYLTQKHKCKECCRKYQRQYFRDTRDEEKLVANIKRIWV